MLQQDELLNISFYNYGGSSCTYKTLTQALCYANNPSDFHKHHDFYNIETTDEGYRVIFYDIDYKKEYEKLVAAIKSKTE